VGLSFNQPKTVLGQVPVVLFYKFGISSVLHNTELIRSIFGIYLSSI